MNTRLSDDIMLYLFDLDTDSDFRPAGLHHRHPATEKNALQLSHLSGVKRLGDRGAINLRNVDITLR
ncbi:hypothetical protein E0H70_21590 [Rhizobium leguminosarum bv. viciae]|nr:hypothetical protein E0H70_21590 [Rhizobium leguminosarum bv. viciae]